MIPMNVPFAKADLTSHILQICLLTWQDQFNLHEKGETPMDMRLILLSPESIEPVRNQERSNASRNEKASHSKKKGTKGPGTNTTARVLKKAHTTKHCNLCKKHGGGYATCVKKDGTENPISAPPRKVERNPIPQSSLSCI